MTRDMTYNNVVNKQKMSGNADQSSRMGSVSPQQLFLEDEIRVKEPVHLFHEWYVEAKKHKQILTPNALCLTTADAREIPSSRMMTLRNFNKQGFQIIGNMNSRKGIELENNPQACITFYWPHLQRSVRIHGMVELLPLNVVKADFERRPVESRIASLFNEGQPVKSRKELEDRALELTTQHGEQVPMPAGWSGYMLVPKAFEFVQKHPNMLNDRIRFRRQERGEKDSGAMNFGEDGWVYERLCP